MGASFYKQATRNRVVSKRLMSEYALLSRTLLRRRFGFDVVIAEEDSSLYKTYVEFFSRVREAPDVRKGLLRLHL